MWYFRIIEIQKNIEEKRLVFGQKFEKFLLKKTHDFFKRIDEFLAAKNFCFWSVSLIFLLSVFLRSNLDIGGDSAVYLDLSAKIASGKKYYFDFYEQNFPLAFWLHLIPFFIAKAFGFNSWIVAEFFINFLGLAAIIFSARILQKTNLNQVHKNLITTSFALGFFLRYYGLESNDFATKTSFLLIFSYLYICFSFVREIDSSKKELVSRGILMALLPCLKPHYIILPLIIEGHSFWQKKSRRFFLELDKLVAIFVCVGYLFLMFKFTPEFFKFIIPISSSIYPTYSEFTKFLLQIYEILGSKIIFFGSVFLIFLRKEFLPEDKILFLVFVAASLILLTESLYSQDQVACFFGLTSFVIIKFFYDFIKSPKLDFKRDNTVIICLLILLFVGFESIEKLKNLVVFWWMAIPVISFSFYKKLSCDNFSLKQKSIFFSRASLAITILVMLILAVNLAFADQYLFLFFSYVIFFVFLFFYEKTYAKFYQKFSSLLVFIQFFLLITLCANYFSSISQAYEGRSIFKSPNFLSEKIITYTKSHLANKGDNIAILSYWIHESSQPLFYLNQSNILIGPTAGYLYKNIGYESSHSKDSGKQRKLAINYFFEDLKKQIGKKNTKILFVETFDNYCSIGFLEFYFQDQEFKKLFLNNYKFAGKIFAAKELKKMSHVDFFSKEKDVFDASDLSKKIPLYDFEIYLRKDDEL